ncbi:NgoFVII family restriction endonuclease [Bacillaceae bacterium SAS-127]|nr:NgoFVII family restriction endonuclease [Bacillaceae bacterium SAS-127]
MSNFIHNLEASLHTGFINQQSSYFGNYRPKLLVNNTQKNEYVLTSLVEELENCQSFLFSVAFITESGLATLKSHFLDLKRKGVSGRILTSTFLQFNQPKVFRELMKISNVEVRLTNVKGFHSKGYIFTHDDYYSLIVGSSNLTAHALKVNYEWNVKLTSHEDGEIVHHFKHQFEDVWQQSDILTEQWIQEYEKIYQQQADKRLAEQVIEGPTAYQTNAIQEALQIQPNNMQRAALEQIAQLRATGEKKGLVISATGTGKTYLSAFDVRRFAPKRMLFIVHREQILHKAKSDFQKVLGGVDEDFGILSGTKKETDAKYLFATIQTIAKENYLASFDRAAFDYILIDEVHKAGAASYQRVIDYFQPQFLMGMTATPERSDDFNIYSLFDYNIAYEIRLQEALEEDMLCPFHYFGVTDFQFNGEFIDDATILSRLVTEERVKHLVEKIEYYGFSGEAVKGLIFCSRKQEAEQLSEKLNEFGYRTVALTGDHSQEDREQRVIELENGNLDYILTVDIFNEGIDIPSINQVVMLRQTQSSIVFIQQLGRGLRKHASKHYVTIIDFIGNYKNNYLIPVALSGDRTQNKDNIRRKTIDTSYIKGVSTIHFEEIAKKKILQSISESRLTKLAMLREAFVELKNRLGEVPLLYDFIANHSIDPLVVVNEHANYYQFLIKLKEDVPVISVDENNVLTMLSQEVLDGKRRHELILLDMLMNKEEVEVEAYLSRLQEYQCSTDEAVIRSVHRLFDLSFFTQSQQKKYGAQPIVELTADQKYLFHSNIKSSLKENKFFKEMVKDIIECGLENTKKYRSEEAFTLYEKYSRKDACKLLSWENDESSTVYGYKTKYHSCIIFVTYHKQDEIEASVNYGDELLSPDLFKWYTRSNRTLQSKEVQAIIEAERSGIDIHIFVKKDNDEGRDFYYLGKSIPDPSSIEQTTMKDKHDKEIPVVCMNLVLEQPVRHQLYHHIKSGAQ